MTAAKARRDAPPLIPANELTRMRHDWVMVVLTLGTDPELKQVVLEYVAAAGKPRQEVVSR